MTRAWRVACAVGLVTLIGCAAPAQRTDHAVEDPDAALDANAVSLYDLDLALTDQHGRSFELDDLRGRPLVVSMVYTSCSSVCPRITADMKAVEQALTPRQRDACDFVLFSLDPGRDTPEALQAFAKSHRLAESKWRLFATGEEGVLELAAALGIKHRRLEDGEIAHSAVIFVVDGNGVVRHRQVGLGEDPVPLMEALRDVGA